MAKTPKNRFGPDSFFSNSCAACLARFRPDVPSPWKTRVTKRIWRRGSKPPPTMASAGRAFSTGSLVSPLPTRRNDFNFWGAPSSLISISFGSKSRTSRPFLSRTTMSKSTSSEVLRMVVPSAVF